ncbi:DUF5994 family protein [Streptomyces sp. NPDC048737]|uniref:DUF5994 family protein n=1 Tax=unclassified Streptomyces TaxID=2593676 RepID=UPI0034217399
MHAPTDHTVADGQLRRSPSLHAPLLPSARSRAARPGPALRLRLAPDSQVPRRLDGVWWPRSDDLLAELPELLAGLPRAWGDIASVMVDGTAWAGSPGRMLVCNQVVRLRRSTAVHAPDTVVLMAPGRGRRDLRVIPPGTTEEAARPLMSAGATVSSE